MTILPTAMANIGKPGEPLESLRDADAIVRILGEGFAGIEATADIRPALECLYALAADNRPIPWPGLIFDLGELLSARELARLQRSGGESKTDPVLRQYEDQVLGKIITDPLLDRMADAILAIAIDKRPQALAFVIHRIQDRLKLPAVLISAGVVRSELERRARPAAQAEIFFLDLDLSPLASQLLSGLIGQFRHADSIFRIEDVVALEHGTALLPFAQYIAHRQILEASRHFREHAKVPLRRAVRQRQVISNLRDEDHYPIGGYSSISTKGAIESLLHSQLAYMEPDGADRPDFFDVKYLRDELFYYARDENDFHRRRRSFWFILHPNLQSARQLDAGAPAQRIVIALAWIDALIQQLTEKLNQESLYFEVVFIGENKALELQPEWELLALIFRDAIQRGDLKLEKRTSNDCFAALDQSRKRISTDAVMLLGTDRPIPMDSSEPKIMLDRITPRILPDKQFSESEGMERWAELYSEILGNWLN